MSEQEVFNKLAELEEYFFYAKLHEDRDSDKRKALQGIHGNIKTALIQWRELTGCKNE